MVAGAFPITQHGDCHQGDFAREDSDEQLLAKGHSRFVFLQDISVRPVRPMGATRTDSHDLQGHVQFQAGRGGGEALVIDPKIWFDQEEFNSQLRQPPTTYDERVELTKEFSLHMMTELAEMLEACGIWQMHRTRHEEKYNPENVRRQLIDQFKYWMSVAQLWGFTIEDMERTYWRKSATVRQRFVEEHIHQIRDREIAVLDIDNVLCDYTV